MSWFKLDDQGAFHAKVLAAGNEAYGAWCRAGQWSSAHLTEGRIPRSTALTLAKTRVWQRLVDAGLCDSLGDEGWQIHDYLEYNPSAEEALAKRASRAEAGRRGGSKKEANRLANGKQESSTRLAIASPVAKQNSTPFPFPFPSPIPEEIHTQTTVARDGRPVEVWDHYVAVVAKHRPRRRPGNLNPKDRAAIQANLKAGFTVADLQRACTGLFRSPHHLGQNDRGTEYLEIDYAMRKPAQFMALADSHEPAKASPQPCPTPPTDSGKRVDPKLIDDLLARLTTGGPSYPSGPLPRTPAEIAAAEAELDAVAGPHGGVQ